MAKYTLFSVAVVGVWGLAWVAVEPQEAIVECRHGKAPTQEDRTRREQAVALAKAINQAEANAVRQTKQYQPLASLGNLPAVPRGFDLKMFADGSGYMFGIKDSLDPCRFAVFSDQGGFLYEKAAMDAPIITPR